MQLGDRVVRVMTHPGFASWDETAPAMQLMAAQARLEAGERALICPCGHGALGVWAASRTDPRLVTLHDTHLVAVQLARQTLAANGNTLTPVEVAVPSAAAAPFDVACLLLPKGRDLARLYLLALFDALRSGGRLYLAGPNKGGIKSVIDDTSLLFGEGQVLAYKAGNRVAIFIRPQEAPDLPEPFAAPGLRAGGFDSFDAEMDGRVYHIATRPGVFARHGLDAGTRLLLDALTVRPTDHVLDLGCGYGIIGMVAAEKVGPGAVTLVDADLIAVQCAAETLRRNGLADVRLLLGDSPPALTDECFTLIVSNPPFHAGHGVTLDVAQGFVAQAHRALQVRGRLVLVANRFLPYHRAMQECFGAVDVVAQTPQYRVLAATKVTKRPRRSP
jgi:16S rRNA (guanine1207-N2)-methyltransferase